MSVRAQIVQASEALAKELRASGLGRPLRFRIQQPRDVDTGGMAIQLATLGPLRPAIEVWYDKYLDGEELVFWVGFSSTQEELIRLLVEDASNIFRNVPSLGIDDVHTRNRVHQLTSVPTRSEEGHPFQEYHGYKSYFGVFGRRADTFDNPRFSLFLMTVLRALPEFNAEDAYPKIRSEGRRVVGWHLRIERRPWLARACKVRDDFRCQVCNFHFVEGFGQIGAEFAEAHHTKPLSKLDGPTDNNPDNLTTVCSNCHRMLHRMEGEQSDISKLRSELRMRYAPVN